MSDKSLPDWHVDTSLVSAIEGVLPDLSQEILDAIALEVPEYARPLEGAFGHGIRVGVDEALRQFVAQIRDPDSDRAAGREVYFRLGHGEYRQGRSLDSLQAAYRVGARVAWRRTSRAAEAFGHEPALVYSLADAIFAYIDELSALSVEGFAAAQSEREGEREMRRARLLAGIVGGATTVELDRLAGDAGWTLPETGAAAACAPEDAGPISRRLGPETLSGTVADLGCLIIADPDGPGRRDELRRAASAGALTVGPSGPLAGLDASWNEAATAHAIRLREDPADGSVLHTEDHLPTLILGSAPQWMERLRLRALSPLEGETPASRARLSATLAVWLEQMGAITATAAALDVHPQTIRYRIARLRELFGSALDEPDSRFELQLALRLS